LISASSLIHCLNSHSLLWLECIMTASLPAYRFRFSNFLCNMNNSSINKVNQQKKKRKTKTYVYA
uniref:Ovule protein n=1 Tax=Brugia timori TaxID=42155 RepID=A0A0R3QY77_9BILA